MSATDADVHITFYRPKVCPQCDGRRFLTLRFSDCTIPWACPTCNPASRTAPRARLSDGGQP